MNANQIRIFDFLENHAVGINHLITVNEIARRLSIPDNGTNNDNVRIWIRNMVEKYRKPIGTCRKGVFLITNEQERNIAINYIGNKNPNRVVILGQVPLYTTNNQNNG